MSANLRKLRAVVWVLLFCLLFAAAVLIARGYTPPEKKYVEPPWFVPVWVGFCIAVVFAAVIDYLCRQPHNRPGKLGFILNLGAFVYFSYRFFEMWLTGREGVSPVWLWLAVVFFAVLVWRMRPGFSALLLPYLALLLFFAILTAPIVIRRF